MGSLLPKSYTIFISRAEVLACEYGISLGKGGKGLKSRKSYPLSQPDDLEEVLEKIASDHRITGEDSVYFGLPLKYFTAVNFELPAAAKKNLDQAVKYSLMRHIPYDLDDAYWHYTYEEKGGNLSVSAILSIKSGLKPVLGEVAASGIVLSLAFPSIAFAAAAHGKSGVYLSVRQGEGEVLVVKKGQIIFQASDSWAEAHGADRFLNQTRSSLGNMAGAVGSRVHLWRCELDPGLAASSLGLSEDLVGEIFPEVSNLQKVLDPLSYKLDFVPASVLKRKKISFYIQCAAVVLLLFSLLCLPGAKLLGKAARLEKLESKIAGMEGRAKQISKMRSDNSKLREDVHAITDYVHNQPYVTELLKEITEVLPTDTWLNSLTYSGGRVVLSGNAPSASATLEALENSPLFKDAAFDSQITKVGTSEHFKIVLRLE